MNKIEDETPEELQSLADKARAVQKLEAALAQTNGWHKVDIDNLPAMDGNVEGRCYGSEMAECSKALLIFSEGDDQYRLGYLARSEDPSCDVYFWEIEGIGDAAFNEVSFWREIPEIPYPFPKTLNS